jgi:hypothetical protein
MPRHPNQNAALDRHHKDRKDQTRQAHLDAMDRLLRGEPLFTDGELTEANLYREAKRSRATLNRYPEIKHRFSETKRHRRENSVSDKDERIRELEETVRSSLLCSPSVTPQCNHRVDFHRPPRRNTASHQRHTHEQQRDHSKRQRVGRAHAKQQRLHQTRQRQRAA